MNTKETEDLWRAAYDELKVTHKSLIDNYEGLFKTTAPDVLDNDPLRRMQTVLDSKRRQILRRQWKFRWGGKSIIIRTQVDRIVRLIRIFSNVGNVASNVDPVHAGLPWAGICFLLSPILNEMEQSESLMVGLEIITNIVARSSVVVDKRTASAQIEEENTGSLQRIANPENQGFDPLIASASLESRVSQNCSSALDVDLKTPTKKLYKAVLEYLAKAVCHVSRNSVVRVARNLPRLDDWNSMLENIRRLDFECRECQMIYHRAISEKGLESLSASFQNQEKILQALVRTQYQDEGTAYKTVCSISEAKVSQDHADVRNRLGHQYWHSGRWLFRHENYMAWKSSQSAVLWLRGSVGVGKTCLTSAVIEETLSDLYGEDMAFFYCSQQHGTESAEILRALLAQLCLGPDGDLEAPVLNWFEYFHNLRLSSGRKEKLDLWHLAKRRISSSECVDLLAEISNAKEQTTLVIDALDECDDAFELLSYLQSLLHKCPRIRLFLSTRLSLHESQMPSQFAQNLTISDFDSTDDMETFIECEINSSTRRARSGMTVTQADQLQRLLVSKSRGMFRWVELQIGVFLSKKTPIRHPKDVQMKLDHLKRHAGHNSLDQAYGEIFAMNTEGQPHLRSLAVKALQWMLCCFKPPNMQTLVQAVGLDPDGTNDPAVDEEFVLQICSNFIITTAAGCAKFAHKSVKDYLHRCELFGVKRQRILTQAHVQAAETCLAFLGSLGDDSKWVALPVDALQRCKGPIQFSSFEMYACFFWASHLKNGGLPERGDLVSDFLLGTPSDMCHGTRKVGVPFQRWISLLWRAFHTASVQIDGITRQTLEDAISIPASPIFAACIWDLGDIASTLLVNDPQIIHSQNHRSKNPLFLACEYGRETVIAVLLKHGAPLDFVHPTWGSIPQAAAWSANSRALEQVVNRHNVNLPRGCYGRLLDAAISGGDERTMMMTLIHGAEIWLPCEPLRVPAMGVRPAVYPVPPKTPMALWRRRANRRVQQTYSNSPKDTGIPLFRCLSNVFPLGSQSMIQRLEKAVSRWHEIRSWVNNCSEAYETSLQRRLIEALGSPVYLCPFEHCTDKERLYGLRQEWVEHVYTHLQSTLMYPYQRSQPQGGDWEVFSNKKEKSRIAAPLLCPLCRVDFEMASPKQYLDHVATHLDDIALLTDTEGHERIVESKDQSSSGSSEEDNDSITAWSSNSEAESGNEE